MTRKTAEWKQDIASSVMPPDICSQFWTSEIITVSPAGGKEEFYSYQTEKKRLLHVYVSLVGFHFL